MQSLTEFGKFGKIIRELSLHISEIQWAAIQLQNTTAPNSVLQSLKAGVLQRSERVRQNPWLQRTAEYHQRAAADNTEYCRILQTTKEYNKVLQRSQRPTAGYSIRERAPGSTAYYSNCILQQE